MSTSQPTNTDIPVIQTSEAIFRNAIAQNAQIHMNSIADLQRHTDEVHAQLRLVTNHHMQRLQLVAFSFVHRAASLEADFWPDTVARAKAVLQRHGELPADAEDPTVREPEDEPSE